MKMLCPVLAVGALVACVVLVRCGGNSPPPAEQSAFIAYSLRAAAKQAAAGDGLRHKELASLGGMTHLIAGVRDIAGDDVILVGRIVPGQPEGSIDDLHVGLDSRLSRGVWPMVSIDPLPSTASTGLQAVRFSPGLEDTEFGRKFLACDVLLKKYSIEAIETTSKCPSYRALVEKAVRSRAGAEGVSILAGGWSAPEPFEPSADPALVGRAMRSGATYTSQFWFHPTASRIILAADHEAFVLEPLHVAVSREVWGDEGPMADTAEARQASERFAAAFAEEFSEIAAVHPALEHLEMLYAMGVVADGITAIGGEATVRALLASYRPPAAPTPREFDLLETVGTFRRSDQADHIVKIAGGIELRTVLVRLHAGDYSALKDIVLSSRPSVDAVSWPLPLGGWRLPWEKHLPSQAEAGVAEPSPQAPGCSLSTQSFVLGPAGSDGRQFRGFPPSPIPPPLPTMPVKAIRNADHKPGNSKEGGVVILDHLRRVGRPPDEMRKSIHDARPATDSLTYEVGPGGTKQ